MSVGGVVSFVRCWTAVIVTAAVLPAISVAHERSRSYSWWQIEGDRAQVTVGISELELSRLPWFLDASRDRDRLLAEYLTRRLQLLAGERACAVVSAPVLAATVPGRASFRWRLQCSGSRHLNIRSDLLLDVAPSHLHFARVTRHGGKPTERVLSDAERAWVLGPEAAGGDEHGSSPADYIALGIEHILTGYDHIVFVLALLLIGSSIGEVARVVTGFTVAHSITLALSVLGYLRPRAEPIEALIGLSIVLVAAENIFLMGTRASFIPASVVGALLFLALAAIWGYGMVPAVTLLGLALFTACYFGLLSNVRRTASLRWSVAFIFGLVHGFGFAGVLSEAELPVERLAAALFGFNAGVEIGQLAVVAVVWPLLRWASRRHGSSAHLRIVEIGSSAAVAIGTFWFVTRAFG